MEWLTLDFIETGPLLNIDGLNDFGIVLNNTINTFAAIVRNRLSSIINAQYATPAVNSAVNKILALIPQDIDLFHSDFYIEGLLYANPTYVNISGSMPYMIVPLET
jgi:hypothetical protein